jgi:hypothetical protein
MKTILLSASFFLFTVMCSAQQQGSKVIFKAVDGSYYTGAVAEVKGNQYKVRYDNTDYDVWMTQDQFTVAANPNVFTSYSNNQAKTTETKTTKPVVQTTASTGSKPNEADITKVMKDVWEKEKSSFSPKVTITINSIIIGASAKATLAEEYEGIPHNALVTAAKIDFTQNAFNSNETRAVRRIMTASVYRDKFGEWAVMNIGTKYP